MAGHLQHLQSLSQPDLEDTLRTVVDEHSADIVNGEEFSGAQAETNATFLDLGEIEIVDVSFTENGCEANFSFRAEGDQDLDRTFSGDVIKGDGIVVVDDDAEVRFRDISAAVEHEGFADE